MKDGTSIAAFGKDGKIIGVRIGVRKRRSDWTTWIMDRMIFSLPISIFLYIMPKEMQQFPIIFKFIGKLQYDVWQMFGKRNCNLIYEDKGVCSARESGVRGLGTELCRRTEELAKQLGCTHTYATVTGKYDVLTKIQEMI